MVGRIVNHHGAARVKKGEERGYFAFGGSTVIFGFQKVGIRLSAALPMSASGTVLPYTLSPALVRV